MLAYMYIDIEIINECLQEASFLLFQCVGHFYCQSEQKRLQNAFSKLEIFSYVDYMH